MEPPEGYGILLGWAGLMCRCLDRPLADDGEADIEEYNKELKARGDITWFSSPWLFTECYLCMSTKEASQSKR